MRRRPLSAFVDERRSLPHPGLSHSFEADADRGLVLIRAAAICAGTCRLALAAITPFFAPVADVVAAWIIHHPVPSRLVSGSRDSRLGRCSD